MNICTNRQEMLALSAGWAKDGQTICLVPTMGNLHDGHLSLVEVAAKTGSRVITSIYVNPLQFAPSEDFDSYPRTTRDDLDKLDATGLCDAVFMPQTMYEDGHATAIKPGGVAEGLESAARPHFFEGVATVVYQLLVQTGADKAVFGEKDFQQLKVIEQMVRDLHMGVEIIAAPTMREPDGVAMSSRNGYLNAAQRACAPALYQALQEAAEALRNGTETQTALTAARQAVLAAGFDTVDYIELCDAASLARHEGLNGPEDGTAAVLLAAAHIGAVRLIDNLRV